MPRTRLVSGGRSREVAQAAQTPSLAPAAMPWLWVSLDRPKEACSCAQHITFVAHQRGRAIRCEEAWRGQCTCDGSAARRVDLDHELAPAARLGRCATSTEHLHTSASTCERVGGFSSHVAAKALTGCGHTSDRASSSEMTAPSLTCDAHVIGALSRQRWDGFRRHGVICWTCSCQRMQMPSGGAALAQLLLANGSVTFCSQRFKRCVISISLACMPSRMSENLLKADNGSSVPSAYTRSLDTIAGTHRRFTSRGARC